MNEGRTNDAEDNAGDDASDGPSHPLDHVIDDREPVQRANEWADAELLAGRSPEELAAELAEQGWDEDEAAWLVEQARRRTRRARGIVTREEVAREAASRHRAATGRSWFIGFPTVSAGVRLLYAIANLVSMNRLRLRQGTRETSKKPENTPPSRSA